MSDDLRILKTMHKSSNVFLFPSDVVGSHDTAYTEQVMLFIKMSDNINTSVKTSLINNLVIPVRI